MNKKLFLFLSLFLVLLFFIFPIKSEARIGVGVGTGKIVVDEKLKSGVIYQLPAITVINTGDEESDYALEIAYHQNQPELLPSKEWFVFKPELFHLTPGAVQVVTVSLNLPLKTIPGNYFSYVEAHPVKKSETGSMSVSIAAASKLYFTVLPSNIFEGLYYRTISLWLKYSPWSNILAATILTFGVILFIKRFFKINIEVKKKNQNE